MAGTRKARKKKTEKTKIAAVEEHKGFKVGESVWCKTLNGEILFAEIVEFHLNDKPIPSVSVTDSGSGKYRTVDIETLSFSKIIKRRKK